MQRNLTKIEGNVRELEAKLKHEQDKFKTYSKDLKEAENRHVCRPDLLALFCCSIVVLACLHKCKQILSCLTFTVCCWPTSF